MKPNGRKFAVRSVFFVMCAVASLVTMGSAETARGTFTLPVEAHWGRVLLAPGEYEFKVDIESDGKLVLIHSKDTGWTGVIMSDGLSMLQTSPHSSLELGKFEGVVYVRELCLGDVGLAFDFSPPSSKDMAMSNSRKTTTIAASGVQ